MSIEDQDPKSVRAGPKQDSKAVKSTLRRIAHELRTPISAIASSADVLQSEAFGPLGDKRYKDYAFSISQSADFALNVVAQAIDDLEAEAATAGIKLTNLDANSIIAASVEQLQPLADDAGVIIDTELENGAMDVRSDAVKLQQIINNVVTNAIKFSPVGSRIRIKSRKAGSSRAVIEVIDSGVGMGVAELARIRSNKAERGQGYRLMHRLARLSGTEIHVDSKRGQGTSVCIMLTAVAET